MAKIVLTYYNNVKLFKIRCTQNELIRGMKYAIRECHIAPDLLSFYAENAAFVIYNAERQIYRTSSIEEFLGTAQTGGTGMNVFVYTNWGVPYLVMGYEE